MTPWDHLRHHALDIEFEILSDTADRLRSDLLDAEITVDDLRSRLQAAEIAVLDALDVRLIAAGYPTDYLLNIVMGARPDAVAVAARL